MGKTNEAIGLLANHVKELPPDWRIVIYLSGDEVTMELEDPDGEVASKDFDCEQSTIPRMVQYAKDHDGDYKVSDFGTGLV